MNPLPPIITLNQLNTLLTRHPYFRDRPSFTKQYWHAQCYLLLKHAHRTNTLPTTSIHNLANSIGISHIVIRYWLRDERLPRLLESLLTHEQTRHHHEATLPHEHHHYRIDPSTVYESVRPLKDQHERTLVGSQANCTKTQLRHIGGMTPGEAVIHLPDQSEPHINEDGHSPREYDHTAESHSQSVIHHKTEDLEPHDKQARSRIETYQPSTDLPGYEGVIQFVSKDAEGDRMDKKLDDVQIKVYNDISPSNRLAQELPEEQLNLKLKQHHELFLRTIINEWEAPLLNELIVSETSSISECLANLDRLVNRHHYLRDHPDFQEQYRKAQWYIVLKKYQEQGLLSAMADTEIAERTNLCKRTFRAWLMDDYETHLVTKVINHEKARRKYEATLPTEALTHRLDPNLIYQFCKRFKDNPQEITSDTISEALEKLLRANKNPSKILFGEFRIYHQHGPRWMSKTVNIFSRRTEEIEQSLNTRMGLTEDPYQSFRIGLVNNNLYIWRRDSNPHKWLNLLAHEYIYFDGTDIKQYLVKNTLQHLDLTERGLSQLIRQISDHPKVPVNTKSILSDFYRSHPYMIGESLHFVLDAQRLDFSDTELFIRHLGLETQGPRRGGILNPRFPKDEAFHEFFSRLFSITVSDGSITRQARILHYYDKERDRIEYVKRLVRTNLGDVHKNEEITNSQTIRLTMPAILGKSLEKLGIPAGDKAIQQFKLSSFILNGTPRIKCAYLEELIPEDGYFRADGKTGSFEWKRATIIDAGPKNSQYNFEPKINAEHKEFIRRFGQSHVSRRSDSRIREQVILRTHALKKLSEQSDGPEVRFISSELRRIIKENPCQLLESEKTLCESLGIKITRRAITIHLYKNGRTSIIWGAKTTGQKDALRWALLAPPSSGYKRRNVEEWLKLRTDANEMRKQLRHSGFEI